MYSNVEYQKDYTEHTELFELYEKRKIYEQMTDEETDVLRTRKAKTNRERYYIIKTLEKILEQTLTFDEIGILGLTLRKGSVSLLD